MKLFIPLVDDDFDDPDEGLELKDEVKERLKKILEEKYED